MTTKIIVFFMLIALQVLAISLAWDYDDTTNIEFEIWGTTDMTQPFIFLGTTTNLTWHTPQGDIGFFKVRARIIGTTNVSDWATVQ